MCDLASQTKNNRLRVGQRHVISTLALPHTPASLFLTVFG